VLPGSSIGEVYELTEVQLADALYNATQLGQAAADKIARQIDTAGDGVPVAVWNALAWPRSGQVQVDVPEGLRRAKVVNAAGEPVPCQRVGRGELLFNADDVPAMGYEVYRIVSGGSAADKPVLTVTEKKLENAFLRVRLNANGEVTSLYDKVNKREAMAGRGNELQLFDDRPMNWDAWDVEYRTREQALPLPDATSVKIVEDGSVRVAVEVVRSFGKSTLRQQIVLGAGSRQVEFHTEVDWREDRRMLKVAFPVDIRAPEATYEVQFGVLRRPTHMNTSWDQAKYEVCAQRWVDLSDATYGVSLLNDCKYGHDIHGNSMRLTLLRAPINPDPQADRGRHTFAYALMPHAGGFAEAGAVRAGYEFNAPLRHTTVEASKGELPATGSFFWVDAPAVVLDTVKKAEDSDDVIVRLYEAHGGRVDARLVTALPTASAVECDLLERTTGKPMKIKDGNLELTFEPFEVKTLLLKL
jgi:alpha-mannosidase